MKSYLVLLAIFVSAIIAGNQSDKILYVNKDEGSLWIAEVNSAKVLKKLDIDDGPHEVAVSSDGKTAVAGNYFFKGSPKNTLKVVDVESGKLLKNIDLTPYENPHGIEFISSNQVLVTAERQNKLLLVNINSGKIEKEISTNGGLHMVKIDDSKNYAYGTALQTGELNIIDLKNNYKVESIKTGQGVEGIGVRPNSSEVWVGNNSEHNVKVVDIKSKKVVYTFETGLMPIRVSFTNDGKYALVSRFIVGDIEVYDADSRKLVSTIDFGYHKLDANEYINADEDKQKEMIDKVIKEGARPIGVVSDPDNKYLYVTLRGQKKIAVVEVGSWKVIKTIEGGEGPDGIAYSRILK